MLRLVLFGLLMLTGCVADYADDNDRRMRMIERSITLPPGAAPVAKYRRYYAWSRDDAGIVDAVYVLGGEPDNFWFPADDMPIVLDGGCTVISIEFSIATGEAISVRCN